MRGGSSWRPARTRHVTVGGDDLPGVLRDCPAVPGTISPYAGAGYDGWNGDDVHRLDAWFSFPTSAAFPPSASDRPVLFDAGNHRIRAVDPDPDSGFETVVDGCELADEYGCAVPYSGAIRTDGTLVFASGYLWVWDLASGQVDALVGPYAAEDVVPDPNDVRIAWLADRISESILRWDTKTGNYESRGYGFSFTRLGESAGGLAISANGRALYVVGGESHAVQAVDADTGAVSVVAGNLYSPGDADGPADDARFRHPSDVALDPDDDTLYVADTDNHRIRAIDLETRMVSTVAGTGEPSCPIVDLLVPESCANQHAGADGGLATEATLYRPLGVDLDSDGNLIVADTFNHRFRVISLE